MSRFLSPSRRLVVIAGLFVLGAGLLFRAGGGVVKGSKDSAMASRGRPVLSADRSDGGTASSSGDIVLCQCAATSPASPCPVYGVECDQCCRRDVHWSAARRVPFQMFAQGEYVGYWRTEHVSEYRLRVDDQLEFTYRLTRNETSTPYELNVGDQIHIESIADDKLNRDLIVQPDGTITLRMLGQVRATRRTINQLSEDLDKAYDKFYKSPGITVTPIKVNTKLEDLRATVDSRAGSGGQRIAARVTPEGTISLPALVSVPAQGLTLRELKREIDERYTAIVDGIEVTPALATRAPRFVYVLGEVRAPGRYVLEGPTTAMQALSLAGSWNVGADLHRIVVFRRGMNWQLMATTINLRGATCGKRPCPSGEIWLNDSDIVLVPKSFLLEADDFINLVFTRGIYGVIPFSGVSVGFAKLTSI